MKSSDFQTTVHGKWLLAGEHAVLRGNPALVFPVPNKCLTLTYSGSGNDVLVDFTGTHGDDLQLLFWGVLEHGLEILHIPIKKVIGVFNIDNNIPVGAGLGVSAAICAAVSRWFAWQQWIEPNQVKEFAQKLEHLFHSESSGVDIAGVTSDIGIVFKHGEKDDPINQVWEPHWYLSYTEQVGITSKCVKAVKELWHLNNPHAKRIDQLMLDSVHLAIEALQSPRKVGLKQLASAINSANLCFKQWGLTSGNVEVHINSLLKAGAIAAKPTGSGAGGYVLSLWEEEPPKHLKSILVPA